MKIGKVAGRSIGGEGRMAARHTAITRAGAAILLAATLAGCGIFGGDEPPAPATSNENYPDLKDVPGQAPVTTSLDEREDIAEGLVSDRKNAMHSDQALRGGTEPPAPAPEAVKPSPVPELKDVPESSMEDMEKQSEYDAKGAIPMPGRGGHDSFAALQKPSDGADEDAVAAAEAASAPTGEDENIAAAPTGDVDVAPAGQQVSRTAEVAR
ncbi:hypothetical protein FHS78_000179 [Parvibaculum indicum]|uniref:hypothetical protein n=1 Tax=Parvibaculum indicum TaxID=562969 RepID=UPI00141E93FF|nr:hypothetical protein [Parvibaculum indicum]NIJ39924.1 hypothetical protein [Parvibaculum indicum]